MKITIGQLREVIKKSLAGSQPDEAYSEELLDDPAFQEKSVYVPDWAKKKIKSWARDMKLSTK
jgi:hypothetical protein